MNEESTTEEHTTSQHHTEQLKPKGDPKPRKQEVFYFEYSPIVPGFCRTFETRVNLGARVVFGTSIGY